MIYLRHMVCFRYTSIILNTVHKGGEDDDDDDNNNNNNNKVPIIKPTKTQIGTKTVQIH